MYSTSLSGLILLSHNERKSRPSDLLRQQHDIVALPDRGHLRSDGKNEMDLIGQQRLHGGRCSAHKYELHFEPLALKKISFRCDHERQNLYARRGKRAAYGLSRQPVNAEDKTEQRCENDLPHDVLPFFKHRQYRSIKRPRTKVKECLP